MYEKLDQNCEMNMDVPLTSENVKEANRHFYDLAANVYEEADGRRGDILARYLDQKLSESAGVYGKERFLDVGCGTGFAAGRANQFFERVDAVDVSPRIVDRARLRYPDVHFLVADSDHLPFENNSFNAVAAIALLHHLLEHRAFFTEAHRVLKPGGVLYTDHDLDRRFRTAFRVPLQLYRLVRDEEKRYRRACPEIDGNLYRTTEIHRNGLNCPLLLETLQAVGFEQISVTCHWFGLSRFFDGVGHLVDRGNGCPQGLAPSLRIWARKRGGVT